MRQCILRSLILSGFYVLSPISAWAAFGAAGMPQNQAENVQKTPYEEAETAPAQEDAVDQRAALESNTADNPYVLSFYQPNYILPFYYTQMPDETVYTSQVTDNQPISHYDLKFQLSFKYPVWNFTPDNKLYIAYTQMSYWQAYQNSAFFRETNYEPEIFLANQINQPLPGAWEMNFFNIGAMHQSNGRGGELERSWNRAYVNFIAGKGGWMFELQPWYIFHDSSMEEHNPDIGHYMGYEQMILAYKYSENQEFALQARNTVESVFRRSALTFTWSFPLGLRHLKGYLQVFSGYGQSLIEYNHYTNSVGLGISLSDWI